MPTLYVENVPKDRYEALRRQARNKGRSISGEIMALLEQNVPTEKELEKRREFFRFVERLHAKKRRHSRRSFQSTEEMQREDRAR
jgi:plasmid stability protein